MDVVVDVGRPHAGGEQQQLVCEEVHGHKEQGPAVRQGLQGEPCLFVYEEEELE